MSGKLRSRIVGEGMEAPEQLLANPKNWRKHPKRQRDALEGLLKEVGWVQRIIVNKRTGHIIDGHLRVELALQRNENLVPVLYVDLSENEENLVLAAIDPVGALAETDSDKLNELLEEVKTQDAALMDMFSRLAMQSEMLDMSPPEEPEIPEPKEKTLKTCPNCGHEF